MSATPAAAPSRPSARERLLAAAGELFYDEGVHVVGIDRVIERAGVAKATLYSLYGSKDGLILAYLAARHAGIRDRMTERLAAYETPRERLLGVFDLQAEIFAEPGFHGCAFVNASAEACPGSPIEGAVVEYRAWLLALFSELVAATDANDPDALTREMLVLYDGAGVVARMDRDPHAASRARAVAERLLAAACER
jgi:AcrR family transcriptional regulator